MKNLMRNINEYKKILFEENNFELIETEKEDFYTEKNSNATIVSTDDYLEICNDDMSLFIHNSFVGIITYITFTTTIDGSEYRITLECTDNSINICNTQNRTIMTIGHGIGKLHFENKVTGDEFDIKNKDFNVQDIIKIINGVVVVTYNSRVWEERVYRKLKLVEPVLNMIISDIRKNWLNHLRDMEIALKKTYDKYEEEYNEIAQKRRSCMEEFNEFWQARLDLEQSEEEVEKSRRK